MQPFGSIRQSGYTKFEAVWPTVITVKKSCTGAQHSMVMTAAVYECDYVPAVYSAARALARKLAEEKQAAVNAAKQAAEQSMDEEEIEAIRASVEQASADAAREAARADALARAARQMGPSGSSQMFDLERLRVGWLLTQTSIHVKTCC